jgi:hypothetical protein
MFASGCGGSDTPVIDGKWDIISVVGDGREMSSGDDSFEFKTDGTAIVRMGGSEETGTWSTIPERKTLVVKSVDDRENKYDYHFSGDSLFLKTVVQVTHHLNFVCVRKK